MITRTKFQLPSITKPRTTNLVGLFQEKTHLYHQKSHFGSKTKITSSGHRTPASSLTQHKCFHQVSKDQGFVCHKNHILRRPTTPRKLTSFSFPKAYYMQELRNPPLAPKSLCFVLQNKERSTVSQNSPPPVAPPRAGLVDEVALFPRAAHMGVASESAVSFLQRQRIEIFGHGREEKKGEERPWDRSRSSPAIKKERLRCLAVLCYSPVCYVFLSFWTVQLLILVIFRFVLSCGFLVIACSARRDLGTCAAPNTPTGGSDGELMSNQEMPCVICF